jgi:hypothetical protein
LSGKEKGGSKIMPIQWYTPRGGKRNVSGDFFSLSDRYLRFSHEACEKYFKNLEYLEVGYEESDNCIFLRPSKTEGFKILKEKVAVSSIRWKGFTSAYRIHFDKTLSLKVQNATQSGLYCLDLKGCKRADQ